MSVSLSFPFFLSALPSICLFVFLFSNLFLSDCCLPVSILSLFLGLSVRFSFSFHISSSLTVCLSLFLSSNLYFFDFFSYLFLSVSFCLFLYLPSYSQTHIFSILHSHIRTWHFISRHVNIISTDIAFHGLALRPSSVSTDLKTRVGFQFLDDIWAFCSIDSPQVSTTWSLKNLKRPKIFWVTFQTHESLWTYHGL